MEFRVHGSVDFHRDGQILIADIGGPWNIELIDLYRQRIAEYVPALAEGGVWGLILIIHGAALCPPDAIEGIRQGVREQAEKWKRVCTSYVIAPEVIGHRVMDRVWRGIYEHIMPVGIFDTLEEALHWTLAKLPHSEQQKS